MKTTEQLATELIKSFDGKSYEDTIVTIASIISTTALCQKDVAHLTPDIMVTDIYRLITCDEEELTNYAKE